jgi:hypothetical protein
MMAPLQIPTIAYILFPVPAGSLPKSKSTCPSSGTASQSRRDPAWPRLPGNPLQNHKLPRKEGVPERPSDASLIFHPRSSVREERPMPCKSLLALLLCPLVLFLIGSVSPNACASPPLPDAPAASAPQGPNAPKPPAKPMPRPTTAAPQPVPQLEPEQPRIHTLTIYNGCQVQQHTFVWCHGSWRTCRPCDEYVVYCRDCPRSPWRCHGRYHSPRCAEKAACCLRADGNQACVRHHCR